MTQKFKDELPTKQLSNENQSEEHGKITSTINGNYMMD